MAASSANSWIFLMRLGRGHPAGHQLAEHTGTDLLLLERDVPVLEPRVERRSRRPSPARRHRTAGPVDRVRPSVPPLNAVSDLTLVVKFFEDASLSMMRSCSMPPAGFAAFAGTMNGSPPPAQMVPNGSLSELSRLDGAADRHLEVLRRGLRRLVLHPGAVRDEQRLALGPGGLRLDVVDAGRALEDVALLEELVVRLEGGLDRRVLPGVRLKVVDGVEDLTAADLADERVEREGEVVRVLARVRPAGDALLLGLLAEGQHLVPGPRGTPRRACRALSGSTRRRRRCRRSTGSSTAGRRTGPSRRCRAAGCRGPSWPGRRWTARPAAG